MLSYCTETEMYNDWGIVRLLLVERKEEGQQQEKIATNFVVLGSLVCVIGQGDNVLGIYYVTWSL